MPGPCMRGLNFNFCVFHTKCNNSKVVKDWIVKARRMPYNLKDRNVLITGASR